MRTAHKIIIGLGAPIIVLGFLMLFGLYTYQQTCQDTLMADCVMTMGTFGKQAYEECKPKVEVMCSAFGGSPYWPPYASLP